MFHCRRLFSSFYDSNRVRLTSAIESIYNDEWRIRGVLPSRKNELQRELMLKDNFLLGPLDYFEYKRSDIPEFLYNMLLTEASLGYLWLIEWVDDDVNMISVYKCRFEHDLLLLMALSKVILNTMIVYDDARNLSKLSDLKAQHYDLLNGLQNVVKVYSIDLRSCMKHLSNSRILKHIDCSTSRGLVFNLVKQIIYLPIYDNMNHKFIQKEESHQ